MGPRVSLDVSEKTKSSSSAGNVTTDQPHRSLVTISTELSRLLEKPHAGANCSVRIRITCSTGRVLRPKAPRLRGGNDLHKFREATFPLQGQSMPGQAVYIRFQAVCTFLHNSEDKG